MEVDEAFGEVVDLLEGGGFAIDAERGAAGETDAAFDLKAATVEKEGGFDGGPAGAGGDDLAAAASAEDERESIDDERLTGAGFAGEDVQAGAGFEHQRAGDGEAGDRDPFKHAG